jgi:hypothetical protein
MRTGLGPAGSGDGGSRRAITDAGGEEIGWIEAAVRDGWSEVRWIELEAGRRGWGHGSEAVRSLEAEVAQRGVRGVRAEVPTGNGLALYFWLRLGYRPEVPGGGKPGIGNRPVAEEDAMVMARELSQ